MTTRRTFTAKFKTEVVLSLLNGRKTQAELCREHQLAAPLISQWKDAFLQNASNAFSSSEERSQEAIRIAELERLVGQLAWENDALKKASSVVQQMRKQGGRS